MAKSEGARNATEAAKKKLTDDKELKDVREERSRAETGWKPTPTQEENDLLKLGASVDKLEPDGSPEEGTVEYAKHMAGGGASGYLTRQERPAQPQPRQRAPQPPQS